jgi:predicted lipoprotein with Yx(FWY)xxD motif
MSLPRLPAAALALAAIALIVAGCGGSMTGSTSSSQPSKSQAAKSSELGPVLVNSEGLTVYAFAKDRGTMSSCSGPCAEAWPPVTTAGAPIRGEGAMASRLGTTKRKDGTSQVTYAGHPIYTFVEDSKPGETNGNGVFAFGAEWHALDGTGSPVAASAGSEGESTTPSESSSESSGGGAYGY